MNEELPAPTKRVDEWTEYVLWAKREAKNQKKVQELQKAIDKAAKEGGGIVKIPSVINFEIGE